MLLPGYLEKSIGYGDLPPPENAFKGFTEGISINLNTKEHNKEEKESMTYQSIGIILSGGLVNNESLPNSSLNHNPFNLSDLVEKIKPEYRLRVWKDLSINDHFFDKKWPENIKNEFIIKDHMKLQIGTH